MATKDMPIRTGNPAFDDRFVVNRTVGHRDPVTGHLVVTHWPSPQVTGKNMLSRTISEVEAERAATASKK